MNLSFRVLATVGILSVAALGCQKNEAAGPAGKSQKSELRAAKSAEVKTAGVSARKSNPTPVRDAGAEQGESRSGGRVSSLTAADNGRDIALRPGQTISLALESNHANGFDWAIVSPTSSVLAPVGKPAYAVRSGRGTETWHFRAGRPGRQTIRLEYRREWTQNMPERTFRFTATVK